MQLQLRSSILTFVKTGLFLLLFIGCSSVSWTEAIRYGSMDAPLEETVIPIEINNGLIFVPVTLKGETYRFLWDTGALFSISEELQNKLAFKSITSGNLTDSDNNRIKVNYVRVDEFKTGTITFKDQTAFVGDFTVNPLLECLKIDGIIGSNLMRLGNWTIDQKKKELRYHKHIDPKLILDAIHIPFKSDRQFNMLVEVKVGRATIKNLTVDYGSNGPLSVTDEVFEVLTSNNILKKVVTEKGKKQSGLAGVPVNITRKQALTDSIRLEGSSLKEVAVRTNTSGLVGNKILSRYIVTIDWDRKQLHLVDADVPAPANNTYGLSIGLDPGTGLIVRSVVENSTAEKLGITPEMKVLQIDTLDFTSGHTYCDYVAYMQSPPDTLKVTLLNETGMGKIYHIAKEPIFEN